MMGNCAKCGMDVDWDIATGRTLSYGLCDDCDAAVLDEKRWKQARQLVKLSRSLGKRIQDIMAEEQKNDSGRASHTDS